MILQVIFKHGDVKPLIDATIDWFGTKCVTVSNQLCLYHHSSTF